MRRITERADKLTCAIKARIQRFLPSKWWPVEERTFTITDERGIHLRTANLMVQVASNFESAISVEKDGQEADGKSISDLLRLIAKQGTKITVRARGQDAKEAMEELGKLIEGQFGE